MTSSASGDGLIDYPLSLCKIPSSIHFHNSADARRERWFKRSLERRKCSSLHFRICKIEAKVRQRLKAKLSKNQKGIVLPKWRFSEMAICRVYVIARSLRDTIMMKRHTDLRTWSHQPLSRGWRGRRQGNDPSWLLETVKECSLSLRMKNNKLCAWGK